MPLAVLWTLGILSALLLPGGYVPSTGLFSFDKVAHFVIFAGFAALWMVALGDTLPRAGLYIVVLGVGYAILTELAQTYLQAGRHGDVEDAIADAAGVLTGVGAWILWRIRHPEPTAPGRRPQG